MPDRDPPLSLTFIAIIVLAIVGFVRAFDSPHPGEAAAAVLTIYAVLIGSPALLKRLLPERTEGVTGTEAAARRRRFVSRALRWPLRQDSWLRRIASWLLIGGATYAVAAANSRLPDMPVGLLAGFIIAGALFGALGWFAAILPAAWKTAPTDDTEVWTVRWIVAHENAEFCSLLLAVVLVVGAGVLSLLAFSDVWGLGADR